MTKAQKAKISGIKLELIESVANETKNKTVKLLSDNLNLSDELPTLEKEMISNQIIQADIDGDGNDEVIITRHEGPYWSKLRIFKMKTRQCGKSSNYKDNLEFDLLGEIRAVRVVKVEDIDSDGKAEIITIEEDKEANQPYAAGYREEVTYKLISGIVTEILCEKIPNSQQKEMR